MAGKELLIIFYKNPIPGKIKKRLGAEIGNKLALKVYVKICQMIGDRLVDLAVDKTVMYSHFVTGDDEWPESFGRDVQNGSDLGARMDDAFLKGFEKGYERIVLIGTDIPGLQSEHIQEAFELLKQKDIVFGPALDGGYYLIGSRVLPSPLFKSMRWSHEDVLRDSLERLRDQAWSHVLLQPLRDVDRASDLKEFPFLWELVYGRTEQST
jgi:rSAM/selenodomain-associated transferase 1